MPDKSLKIVLLQVQLQIHQSANIKIVPFGLVSLASMLKKHQVGVVHKCIGEFTELSFTPEKIKNNPDIKELFKSVKKFNPDILGISVYDMQLPFIKELIKQIKPFFKGLIIVGGPSAILYPKMLIDLLDCDMVIRGDGEFVFKQVTEILSQEPSQQQLIKELSSLSGILYRDNAGNTHNFSVHKIHRLSSEQLNSIDINWNYLNKTKDIYFQTSRGCMGKCSFCCPSIPKKWRGLTTKKIIEYLYQIKETNIYAKSGTKIMVTFSDDDFLEDQNRAIQFFKEYSKHQLYNHFYLRLQASIRSLHNEDKINTDLIDAIKGSQIALMAIGSDAMNNSDLALYQKGYEVDKIINVTEYLTSQGIRSLHHVIFSNHLSTPQTILESLENIKQMSDKQFNFKVLINHYLIPSKSALINRRIKEAGMEHLIQKQVIKLADNSDFDIPFGIFPQNINALELLKEFEFTNGFIFVKNSKHKGTYEEFISQLPKLITLAKYYASF